MEIIDKPTVTLLIYEIIKPNWVQVKARHRQKIVEEIVSGGWHTVNGHRQGFLNCRSRKDLIYGYFAREGSLRVEQYDENQSPKEDEQDSFERMLFVLLLKNALLLTQSIRVYHYRDLTGPDVRNALFQEFEIIFRKVGLAFKELVVDRYQQRLNKEQLFAIFLKNSITRIEVDGLRGMEVPEELRFFNPDFDADEFTKAIINEALNNSDDAVWSGGDLQEVKIIKGLAAAGNPKTIYGIDEQGMKREWSRSGLEDLTLSVDTQAPYFPKEDLERLLRVLQRKIGRLADSLSGSDDSQEDKRVNELPLFE